MAKNGDGGREEKEARGELARRDEHADGEALGVSRRGGFAFGSLTKQKMEPTRDSNPRSFRYFVLDLRCGSDEMAAQLSLVLR